MIPIRLSIQELLCYFPGSAEFIQQITVFVFYGTQWKFYFKCWSAGLILQYPLFHLRWSSSLFSGRERILLDWICKIRFSGTSKIFEVGSLSSRILLGCTSRIAILRSPTDILWLSLTDDVKVWHRSSSRLFYSYRLFRFNSMRTLSPKEKADSAGFQQNTTFCTQNLRFEKKYRTKL